MSSPWVWVINRTPVHDDCPPAKAPSSLIEAMMGVDAPHAHHATSYRDTPALFNVELSIMVWERKPDDTFAYPITLVQFRDDKPWPIAETVDEFAAKVGAPPRPQVEVPDAFRSI